jgi:hypothetical protein
MYFVNDLKNCFTKMNVGILDKLPDIFRFETIFWYYVGIFLQI